MGRYIDADAFLEHMKKTPRYFHFLGDIEYFPTADVEPVRHGKWMHIQDDLSEMWRKDGRK